MEVSGCGSSIEDSNSIPRAATDAAAAEGINGIENVTGELGLDVKDEIIKEMASISTSGDGTRNDNGHVLAWLNNFSQQLKSFFESNNQSKHLGELKDSIRALSTQMEMLNSQMREMQLLFLKSSLTVQTTSPGVCAAIKKENFFLPQDQVYQTPKMLQGSPMRLNVTPVSVSTNSDTDQKRVDSTLPSNSRRTLTFPKSLEAILDEHKVNNRKNNRCTTRDAAIHEGATPTLSLVDIKFEPGPVESPHCNSKLGLLVLADAALALTPKETGFTPRSGESFPDYNESGQSASGNGCRSSPSVNQGVINLQAGEKYDRYGVYPTNRNIQVSKRLKSELSSSSSTSYAKLRRRETTQSLPCKFCGQCFNNQSSLRQHKSFHLPVRPYKCENDKCDKAYKTKSELNRHLVVHSGEKKHECKLCGKRFLRKQYLKAHLLRYHDTGIAMVAPSAIGIFKDNSTGTIPSIVVSSSFVSKTEPLMWRCQMCFKIFVDNDDLTRHLRSYHGQEKTKGMDEKIDSNNVST